MGCIVSLLAVPFSIASYSCFSADSWGWGFLLALLTIVAPVVGLAIGTVTAAAEIATSAAEAASIAAREATRFVHENKNHFESAGRHTLRGMKEIASATLEATDSAVSCASQLPDDAKRWWSSLTEDEKQAYIEDAKVTSQVLIRVARAYYASR